MSQHRWVDAAIFSLPYVFFAAIMRSLAILGVTVFAFLFRRATRTWFAKRGRASKVDSA